MDLDRMFVRSLGCQYLPKDYHPALDFSGKPAPYCGSHDLHGESVYCKHHYPVVYKVGSRNRKKS